MKHLDTQMRRWAPRLRDDLGVSSEASNALASSIVKDTRALPGDVQADVRSSTPVALRQRLEELTAFQAFMDMVRCVPNNPPLTRAQVIVQNYVCFVYLGDACFKVLRRRSVAGSTLRRCTSFLTDNRVRAFRNAVAHGNWSHTSDFSGLVNWACKGDDHKKDLDEFRVSDNELDFWQSLARCTAYAVYATLEAS